MTNLKKMVNAARDKSSLGNLLVREKIVTQSELNILLAEFSKLKVEELLGQFLVRKGILSPERLELLLMRQEGEWNGGIERQHVKRAFVLAHQTSQKVTDGVGELVSSAQMVMAKVGEAK